MIKVDKKDPAKKKKSNHVNFEIAEKLWKDFSESKEVEKQNSKFQTILRINQKR